MDPLADHPNQIDKSPYAYAWNNPVLLTDPDGRCPICPFLAKGLTGAAVDYMLQGAFNYAGGMSMGDAFSSSNIDISDVALSGVQGALPWSVPGGKYGKAAGAAVADVMFNYAKAIANGEDYSMEQMGQDFLIGFAAQLGSEKVGELFGDKIDNLTKFSPINPGPLPEAIAKTFRSATYTENVSDGTTTLYRVYGGKAGELGSYWTRTKPSGPVQSIIDSALDPSWGNTATKTTSITLPKGTKFYEGVAARQGGLVGGGNQVYIPKVNPSWINK